MIREFPTSVSQELEANTNKSPSNDDWVSKLKAAFHDVDKSNTGRITKDQFINSRLNNLVADVPQNSQEMEQIFDQINTSIDSRITWNQLLDYLMTQNQNSNSFKVGKEISIDFVAPPLSYSSQFIRCPKIIRALYISSMDLLVSLTEKFMSLWNPKNCQQVYELPNDSEGTFTDVCYIQPSQRLAISLSNRNIIFFDPKSLQKIKESISATIDSKK
ncbi:hypothetical protein TVAG_054470 [Trichomonas vaginalis G3]|uniref:EF-hand domain-containing protein n=1 Tax=Trichomonas vaginalis (strain ATCC PRA-98 / G3) TaxID=412133 RepID=A2EYC2_TRIV3|nr:EF-hand family [Trichomonas vaginalis G3]EAY02349.1 hypothetical protein TVAG_054470 [Trichomonas vaginalis G3]KAI5514047.1 EF-hand family [Trichomonas vaginalis G3]|eukprot:XP_001330616.1 hypothetical protein [Trichomonas vaginalis G3]